MGRKYLGGSGNGLTVWISLAASTVLIFYGYDQVEAYTLRISAMLATYLSAFIANELPSLLVLQTGCLRECPRISKLS